MTSSGAIDEGMDPEKLPCRSCTGTGQIDIGDPEDGIVDVCPACDGLGNVPDGDIFIPERDALTPND